MDKIKNCKKCENNRFVANFSWLPTFVIAILPKCPFCVMAYSGAVSLCSGKMLFPNADSSSSMIILMLSTLVILGISLNWRDDRTKFALTLSIIGISLIAYAQFIEPSQSLYYLGVIILLFAVWFNGSFLYFYRNYFSTSKLFKT